MWLRAARRCPWMRQSSSWPLPPSTGVFATPAGQHLPQSRLLSVKIRGISTRQSQHLYLSSFLGLRPSASLRTLRRAATSHHSTHHRLQTIHHSTQGPTSTAQPNCVVLHITPPRSNREDRAQEGYALQEACALAQTLGYAVPMYETLRLRAIHPKTYIGKGKVVELRGMLRAVDANALFINTARLTALQQKNISELCQVNEVKDRISVILEIFSKRARTTEAKVQVELAQCKYALSHLVRGAAAAYEQQRGASGTGFMAGGGEKALEIQRRLLRQQVKFLQGKLRVVKKRRTEQRKHRQQPSVSLVGYTNVGKSSLLNALTRSESVTVEDRPFETLDTTTRSLFLPSLDTPTLLIDTVGFISQLPLELVASFRATLEEVVAADLLLHVRDASTIGTPLFEAQRRSVDKVLGEIGTHEHLSKSVIEVWNKIDLLETEEQKEMLRMVREAREGGREEGGPPPKCVVLVSARMKEGLNELMRVVGERLVEGGHVKFREEEEKEEAEQESMQGEKEYDEEEEINKEKKTADKEKGEKQITNRKEKESFEHR